MRIVQTRRISQLFFFCLFIWFCLVATLGDKHFQIQGWPVNWFLQLDPLVALATILSTHILYKGLFHKSKLMLQKYVYLHENEYLLLFLHPS